MQITDSLNRPIHDLRISVTDRCNFRCGYCMPKDVFGKGYPFLPVSELLEYSEIVHLVSIFSRLGVEKIRLTGGEPLLRSDLETLIRQISDVEGIQDIAITTNASLLSRERAQSLLDAGIKRINISLDAITPEIYQQINQIQYPLETILSGVANALDTGFDVVKVNMVVQKDINHGDIIPMVKYFRGSDVILRFIEFMDVGNHNQWNLDKVFTAREIIDVINSAFPVEPVDPNYRGEVAKRWKYVDGQGEIGVISSITQPFCGNCARARLSAKGELFTCLFATGGYDLRKLIKNGMSDKEIEARVSAIWQGRDDQYSMLRQHKVKVLAPTLDKVEMSYIGG